MIVKAEGIVLSAMKYRETSKIVRLYTREFGKISVIAKGAREINSKFRSALEPMNRLACVIYKNDNRELQLLAQCDVLATFRHLCEDMAKMQAALSAIELLTIVTHEEETNEAMFTLLINHLDMVNRATNDVRVALYYFEMKLAEILGFKPELDRCPYCGKEIAGEMDGQYSMTDAGVACGACGEGISVAQKITPGTLRVLQRLQQAETMNDVMNLRMTKSGETEVRQMLDRHFRTHVDGFHGLKAEEVFGALS